MGRRLDDRQGANRAGTRRTALDQILNGPEVVDHPEKRVNGFVLMIFPYGEKEGRCNYISNGADRADIAKLFEEQAKKFRGPPPP